MYKLIALITMLSFFTKGYNQTDVPESFYAFEVTAIDGKTFDFKSLKGKKVMIVNTASKCGFTPQYAALQSLYETYGNENFEILAFPANDFMKQEPGTNEEIQAFCNVNYSVTFPMMSKISVKGKNMHPLYQWLTNKKYNGLKDSKVAWNFQKYLINESGELEKVISPKTKPNSQEIIDWISG